MVTEGEDIEISLLTGNDLVGKSLPDRLDQYPDLSYSYNHRPGEMGGIPASVISRYNQGKFAGGYQSIPKPAKLAPEAFAKYRREEGLEQYAEQSTRQIVVEQYTRYARALVSSASDTSLSTIVWNCTVSTTRIAWARDNPLNSA